MSENLKIKLNKFDDFEDELENFDEDSTDGSSFDEYSPKVQIHKYEFNAKVNNIRAIL